MARIFTEGFEMGDVVFFDTSSNLSIQTNYPRSGVYCARIYGSTTGSCIKNIPASSAGYLRFSVYSPLWGSQYFFQLRIGSSTHMELRRNTGTGYIEIYQQGSTLVATGTHTLAQDTHYLIEIEWTIADSGGLFNVKVEGETDVSFTGDTKYSSSTTADNFRWFCGSNTTSMYMDDFAYNDTSGASDNSWCGDGKIIMVSPNAAGDVTQLTPSAGNNYACVDEVPPNNDTDYVSSGTAGQYDLYNVASPTLPEGYVVGRLWVDARAMEESAGADHIQIGIKPSGGSEAWSSDRIVTTSYARYVSSEYTVNPADSQAWEQADLNALQIGVKVV